MQVYLSRSQELLSGRKDNLGHINFPANTTTRGGDLYNCPRRCPYTMLSIRTASVGFVQSLYLSFLASVHIFLFYSHTNPLYSHSILLTKDADPRISFPFSDYYAERRHLEGHC